MDLKVGCQSRPNPPSEPDIDISSQNEKAKSIQSHSERRRCRCLRLLIHYNDFMTRTISRISGQSADRLLNRGRYWNAIQQELEYFRATSMTARLPTRRQAAQPEEPA